MSRENVKLMSDSIQSASASLKYLKKTYGAILFRNSLHTIFKNAGLSVLDVEDVARRMRREERHEERY